MFLKRLAVYLLLFLLLTNVWSAYAAGNTIAPTKADNVVITTNPNDFKPAECAGLTLVSFDKNVGNALILGTAGSDSLNGGNDSDCIVGGDGADTLRGLSGDDILVGGSGNDALDGGNGTDVCYGGSGTDTTKKCETEFGIP